MFLQKKTPLRSSLYVLICAQNFSPNSVVSYAAQNLLSLSYCTFRYLFAFNKIVPDGMCYDFIKYLKKSKLPKNVFKIPYVKIKIGGNQNTHSVALYASLEFACFPVYAILQNIYYSHKINTHAYYTFQALSTRPKFSPDCHVSVVILLKHSKKNFAPIKTRPSSLSMAIALQKVPCDK